MHYALFSSLLIDCQKKIIICARSILRVYSSNLSSKYLFFIKTFNKNIWKPQVFDIHFFASDAINPGSRSNPGPRVLSLSLLKDFSKKNYLWALLCFNILFIVSWRMLRIMSIHMYCNKIIISTNTNLITIHVDIWRTQYDSI